MKKQVNVNNKKIKMVNKHEFIFNIVSITIIIVLGIFFGYRSLYYYSKQNTVIKKEEETLKASVLKNNKLSTETNGLHKEKKGYMFKGMVDNNYVSFANRLYRIMSINEDNSVKIVSNTNEGIINFGDDNNYKASNLNNWLNKSDTVNSGIYYNTIPAVEELLKKTSSCNGVLTDKEVKCNSYEESYFAPLSIKDYVDSLGKNSYLYNKQASWLLGLDNNNNNLYITTDGSVSDASSYEGYGIRVVMTLKKNIKVISGSGTLGDPYVINQEEKTNNINKYVKLGEDIYKIYEESGNNLRLSLNDYLKVNGNYIERQFSNRQVGYTPLNRYNIAYYLNRDFYNSLSYKTLLSECTFNLGEISSTEGYSYLNQYKSSINNKVGLLSLYDFNNNSTLTDYYLINTTSGSMAWIFNKDGFLEEDKVTEKKKIVPTVCLDKTLIKSGEGNLEKPYVVE